MMGNSLAEFENSLNGEWIMKRVRKIAITGATAISLALAAAAVSAQPFGYGVGGGHMGAYGAHAVAKRLRADCRCRQC